MRRTIAVSLAILGLSAAVFAGGSGESSSKAAEVKFPTHPITMICPFAAGGGTDAVARMVASLMEQDLKQPVTVVNKPGGGGAVGHTAGATAAPDGYTLTLATSDVVMLHWMGVAEVTYKDLKGVGLVNFDASSINVRADAPWKTVFELQEYAKANPGKLKASGTGKGGCWDLARAGWLMTVGLPVDSIPWVPSTGAAPSLQELLAGGIQVVPCSIAEARSLIDAKKVKSLSIMADKRMDLFPDVPTLKEQGINWSEGVWRGVIVPKTTPDAIVAILEKSLENSVKSPKFKEFMDKSGLGIWWKPAAEFDKFMASEDASKEKVMRGAGLIK